eukprot:EG_transcript_63187
MRLPALLLCVLGLLRASATPAPSAGGEVDRLSSTSAVLWVIPTAVVLGVLLAVLGVVMLVHRHCGISCRRSTYPRGLVTLTPRGKGDLSALSKGKGIPN